MPALDGTNRSSGSNPFYEGRSMSPKLQYTVFLQYPILQHGMGISLPRSLLPQRSRQTSDAVTSSGSGSITHALGCHRPRNNGAVRSVSEVKERHTKPPARCISSLGIFRKRQATGQLSLMAHDGWLTWPHRVAQAMPCSIPPGLPLSILPYRQSDAASRYEKPLILGTAPPWPGPGLEPDRRVCSVPWPSAYTYVNRALLSVQSATSSKAKSAGRRGMDMTIGPVQGFHASSAGCHAMWPTVGSRNHLLRLHSLTRSRYAYTHCEYYFIPRTVSSRRGDTPTRGIQWPSYLCHCLIRDLAFQSLVHMDLAIFQRAVDLLAPAPPVYE
ncbi:hypothetical protein J3F83DRAFT_483259 [Trichoderma novae-zelandiae]